MRLTHVTLPVCQMDVEQLRCCVSLGAVLEYSYCHILSGKCTAEYTRHVGQDHMAHTNFMPGFHQLLSLFSSQMAGPHHHIILLGGINPAAVEAAAKMGAKLLWFPTMDAKLYRKEAGAPDWESGLSALNGSGRVSEEALSVLHMAKKYNMVVGTGSSELCPARCGHAGRSSL